MATDKAPAFSPDKIRDSVLHLAFILNLQPQKREAKHFTYYPVILNRLKSNGYLRGTRNLETEYRLIHFVLVQYYGN